MDTHTGDVCLFIPLQVYGIVYTLSIRFACFFFVCFVSLSLLLLLYDELWLCLYVHFMRRPERRLQHRWQQSRARATLRNRYIEPAAIPCVYAASVFLFRLLSVGGLLDCGGRGGEVYPVLL